MSFVPGWYRLVNFTTKTTLDIRGPGAPKGNQVALWSQDTNRSTQSWEIGLVTNTGHYVLKHSDSTLYVTAQEDSSATLTDQTLANWDIIPGNQGSNSWVLKLANTEQALDIDASATNVNANGTKTKLTKVDIKAPTPSQNWIVTAERDPATPIAPGVYKLRNLGSRSLLEHTSAAAGEGTDVKTFLDNKAPEQEWIITQKPNTQFYEVKNVATGLYLSYNDAVQKKGIIKARAATSSWSFRRSKEVLGGYYVFFEGTNYGLNETNGKPLNASPSTTQEVTLQPQVSGELSVNQRWWFEPVSPEQRQPLEEGTYIIRNALCRTVMQTARTAPFGITGAQAVVGDTTEQFEIKIRADGTDIYDMKNIATSKFLGYTAPSQPNVSATLALDKSQGFYLRKHSDSTFTIHLVGVAHMLWILTNAVTIGTGIPTAQSYYQQKWIFERVEQS